MTIASSLQTRPTRQWLRIAGILLTLLGLLVASYMSWAELTNQATSCPGHTENGTEAGPDAIIVDCDYVQSSVYAKAFGIPVALLGLGGYLAILAAWLLEDRVPFLEEYGHLLVFGLALFGFLFTLYLTYAELFIMYTVCTWCLTSAALMTLVFIVATARVIGYFRETPA
jgi:uncharacterized membrane protein